MQALECFLLRPFHPYRFGMPILQGLFVVSVESNVSSVSRGCNVRVCGLLALWKTSCHCKVLCGQTSFVQSRLVSIVPMLVLHWQDQLCSRRDVCKSAAEC